MISKVKPVVKDTGDKSRWFEVWFDSPYYEILYKDRNENEAEQFIDNLLAVIKPQPGAKILDVACGNGLRSVHLNKKGFDVTGVDLSDKSILHNKQYENETLNFYLQDMREVFRANYFDVVLNLFSSFGYYDKERDNLRSIIAASMAIKQNGIFVFDYINAPAIRAKGNSSFEKESGGILFKIEESVDDKFVRKNISFNAEGKDFHFTEQLALIDKDELEKYFIQSGLAITEQYGNYKLESYVPNKSERLILLAKKAKR